MTKKTMRAGERKLTRKASRTAATIRAKRKTVVAVPRRPVFETWATMAPPDPFSEGNPSICLWGSQRNAFGACDADETVCLVRVEVLEVLDDK